MAHEASLNVCRLSAADFYSKEKCLGGYTMAGRNRNYGGVDDREQMYTEDEGYEEYQPQISGKRKERKKKGGSRSGVFLGALTFILGVVIVAFAFLLLFHIQNIEVSGQEYAAEYSSKNDIISWVQQDKYAVNSVYVWWKYNHTNANLPSWVESMKVKLVRPWSVKLIVTEKEIAGYIECGDRYLYFDKAGTAILKNANKITGVAYIEGLDVDESKVELGETLPVSNEDVFEQIVEVSRLMLKYSLTPDRIVCAGGAVTLYFGNVEVMLGKNNYEDRIAQIPPILEKLKEQYPDKAGTLHLENYETSDSTIRFVPKTEGEGTV